MNFKIILKNTILIFIIASIFHFIYTLIPCFLTSLIFPVNESIWEHLKLIFTTTIFYTLIFDKDKFLFLKAYIRSLLIIIILLLIYLPVNYFIGENLIITLIIMLISIFISEIIIFKIPKEKDYKSLNIISIALLIINFIIFSILTYYPLKTDLFLDKKENKYGINILNK